jgi:hypothetical protein
MSITLNASTITMNSGSVVQDPAGTAPSYLVRAWVLFNGSAATVTGSGNVTSVGRSGTGNNSVTLTTAIVAANYAVATSSSQQYRSICVNSKSVGSFNTLCCGVNVNFGDDGSISCVLLR